MGITPEPPDASYLFSEQWAYPSVFGDPDDIPLESDDVRIYLTVWQNDALPPSDGQEVEIIVAAADLPLPLGCGDGVIQSGEQCDDGNNIDGDCCTANCVADPVGTLCADDGNVCTDNICDGGGACIAQANTAPCDNGVFCDGVDICSGVVSVSLRGIPARLARSATISAMSPLRTASTPSAPHALTTATSARTTSAMAVAPALHKLIPRLAATESSAMGVDLCSGGACVSAGDPCAAGSECDDFCNESAENCFNPIGTSCTDDGNVCTDNVCDGAGACSAQVNNAPCDDDLYCTATDTCSGGTCVGQWASSAPLGFATKTAMSAQCPCCVKPSWSLVAHRYSRTTPARVRLEEARLGRLGPLVYLPEPGFLWQLGSGIGLLALLAKRRNRRIAKAAAEAPGRTKFATAKGTTT